MSHLGDKHDQGKPRWSLIPLNTLEQVVKVLDFGAAKYSVGNWAHVPEARTRYYDATMRHINAWWHGEKNDPDSGHPHLAHAVASLMFLMWFDSWPEKKKMSNAEYWEMKHQEEQLKLMQEDPYGLKGWEEERKRAEALAEVIKRRQR